MQTYIKDFFGGERPSISFEVFPPKNDADITEIYSVLGQLATLNPDFISVTYGAGGGGNSNKTVDIASSIQNENNVCSLAHLTCIGADDERIERTIIDLEDKGVKNVLALRGDIPDGYSFNERFRYAEDLIRKLRERGGFCIGAACYPEGHIECDSLEFDTECLRRKQEAGADFLVTQLFFDNDYFYRFIDRARGAGINIPIIPGVMPILSQKQIARMIFTCGVSLPSGIIKLLNKYEKQPNDLFNAGVEYMAKQAEDLLASGVDGVHLYTMNKPNIAAYCMERLGRTQP